MQSNERKFKINFLDFLLLMLIIATVSAAIVSVFRSNPNKISGGNTTITYKVTCDMIDATAASNIKLGDNIYDNDSNQLLGEVVAEPVITPITAKNSDNTDVPTEKVTLVLQIKAPVWKDKGKYSVDKYDIIEGKEIVFHSEKCSFSGLCSAITEL